MHRLRALHVTGELLKWKVICVLPAPKTKRVRRSSIHREIGCLDSCRTTASLRLITKSVGCVLMMLLQAGVVVVTAKPTSSLSVNVSC